MEANNKVLVIAVLVLLLGVVTFNFNSISGRQVQEDVRVSVNPQVIDFAWYMGEYGRESITATVTAPNGVEKKFYLHRGDGTRVGGSSENLCNRNICFGTNAKTVYFDGDDLSDGQYFFRFTRGRDGVYDSPRFTIVHN